jgi:hypothetical protein
LDPDLEAKQIIPDPQPCAYWFKKGKTRPLLARMRTTDDKEVLLDNAKYLRNTHISNVGINDNKDLTSQEGD